MNAAEKETLLEKVRISLDKIRPYLQADGGDLELIDLTDEYKVEIKFTGACAGCPYSIQTLKGGVEQSLIKEVPEIVEVVAI